MITISTRDYSIEQWNETSLIVGNVTRKIGVRAAVKYTHFARIYIVQEYT